MHQSHGFYLKYGLSVNIGKDREERSKEGKAKAVRPREARLTLNVRPLKIAHELREERWAKTNTSPLLYVRIETQAGMTWHSSSYGHLDVQARMSSSRDVHAGMLVIVTASAIRYSSSQAVPDKASSGRHTRTAQSPELYLRYRQNSIPQATLAERSRYDGRRRHGNKWLVRRACALGC